jgi:ComF family protein
MAGTCARQGGKGSGSFLKKEPKNFYQSGLSLSGKARPRSKSFLLLFFKKEGLPSFMFATTLLDLLLPPHCAGCLGPVESQGQLCAICFAQIGFVVDPCCRRCGLPLASESAGGMLRLCEPCRRAPPPWGRARAALLYDGKARSLILRLKHAGGEENAALLARHMVRAGAALLAQADLLVPVPLHRWRLLRRGYNQSGLLARHIAKAADRRLSLDALRRARPTPSLGGLSAQARAEAMANAIAVRASRRGLVQSARILLVDDVLTSGATAGACTRALLDAGAASVDVLVASRVPDPRDT